MKAIINARIYDYHTYHENAFILFDETIREVGPMSAFKNAGIDEIIDLDRHIVLPGFVAGHTHLYSAFARGMNVPFNPKNFPEILHQLWWKLDHYLDLDMIRHSAFSFGLDQMMAGSTTLIDHHASHTIEGSLDAIQHALNDELGLRAILAFETSDRYDVDQAIQENETFIQTQKSPYIAGLFGLHASFTLSDETLQKVKEHRHGAGIHIHVAESVADETDALERCGLTVIERLDRFGLLDDKALLVHCANVSDNELDLIKKRHASIVVNTTSNMNNAVGLPDLKKMKERNIKVFIGNDGLIPSMPIEYLNAYYTAHLKTMNPTGLSIGDIEQMIVESHRFASDLLCIRLGEIKPGFAADLVAFPYEPFTPLDKTNVFGHLFFGVFPNAKPDWVICGGKTRVENGQIEKQLIQKNHESIDAASRLWKRIEKEGMHLEFKNQF